MFTDTGEKSKIIAIDDNEEVLSILEMLLNSTGQYEVETYVSGLQGLEKLLAGKGKYDAAIVDLNLVNVNGKFIVEQARQQGMELPILILTANSSNAMVVDCLRAGADDYVMKPFDSKVLLARLETLLRRSGLKVDTNIIVSDELTLDKEKVELRRGDKFIELTAKEFQLLAYLLQNRGKVLSRSKILENVWGYDNLSQARVVDVHVAHLRKKLNKGFSKKQEIVQTVRGFGYRVL
jgi:two-component system OmpR family response regulator